MVKNFYEELDKILINVPNLVDERGESIEIPIEYFNDRDAIVDALNICCKTSDNNHKLKGDDIVSFKINRDTNGNFFINFYSKNKTCNPLIIPLSENRIQYTEKGAVVPLNKFMNCILRFLFNKKREEIKNYIIDQDASVFCGKYLEHVEKINEFFTEFQQLLEVDPEKYLLQRFENLTEYISYINTLTMNAGNIITFSEADPSIHNPRKPRVKKGKKRANPIIESKIRMEYLEGKEVEIDGKKCSLGIKPVKIRHAKSKKSNSQYVVFIYKFPVAQDGYNTDNKYTDTIAGKNGYFLIFEPIGGDKTTSYKFVSEEQISNKNEDIIINDVFTNAIIENLEKPYIDLYKSNHTTIEKFVSEIEYMLKGSKYVEKILKGNKRGLIIPNRIIKKLEKIFNGNGRYYYNEL